MKSLFIIKLPSIETVKKFLMLISIQFLDTASAKMATLFQFIDDPNLTGKIAINDRCLTDACDDIGHRSRDFVIKNSEMTLAPFNSSVGHLVDALCEGRLYGAQGPGVAAYGKRVFLFATNTTGEIRNLASALTSICEKADEVPESLAIIGMVVGGIMGFVVLMGGAYSCFLFAPTCWSNLKKLGNACKGTIATCCHQLFPQNRSTSTTQDPQVQLEEQQHPFEQLHSRTPTPAPQTD